MNQENPGREVRASPGFIRGEKVNCKPVTPIRSNQQVTEKNQPPGHLEDAITALGRACGFLTLARSDPRHFAQAAAEFSNLAAAATGCKAEAQHRLQLAGAR
jgi:hypothetical protein